MTADIVTDHAVIRWLERVESLDLPKVRKEAQIVLGYEPEGDRALLEYMSRYHRLDVHAVRRRIATAWVRNLVSAGVRFIPVQNRRVWLRVLGGKIATVITHDHHRNTSKSCCEQ